MKYIRALILLIMIVATSSIIWLGFTGEHESLFRLCISVAVFASLYFSFTSKRKRRSRRK